MNKKNSHHHHHGYRNIKLVAILNIIFTIVEFIGGVLTNSLAIITDALHDLGDSLVLLSAWKIEKVSHKKPDWKRTFGYRRLSLISAFINAVVLLGGSIVILFQAIGRLIEPQPVEPLGMIGIAIVGIIANTIGSFQLKHGKTLNERVLSWNLMEDVLGWVGVLIAATVIYFTNLYIIDPILTILFTGIVLWGVWRNSKELFNIFLEGAPSEQPLAKITGEIENIENIRYVYDIHLWSLDGEHHLGSVKAIVEESGIKNHDKTIREVKEILQKYNVTHSTVELERCLPKESQEQDFLK